MILTKREDKNQVWKLGDVIGDGDSFFMICSDGFSYRLVGLQGGTILSAEYKNISELKKDCGDFNPVNHAELIISG